MNLRITRTLLLTLILTAFLAQERGFAESVHTKRITQATLDSLHNDFLMSEALTVIKESQSRSSSKEYLRSPQSRFRFIATQEQGPMVLDGYSVKDLKSPIIGYSLFYYGADGPLMIVDATVNVIQEKAIRKVAKLVDTSFDSVSNPDGSEMYFLGIYDLDATRLIKVMVRKAQTPFGTDYSIRYAVSPR